MADPPVRPSLRPAPFAVPTSEQLVLAILAGDAEVRRYRAMFRVATPHQHVRSLLVQAIDPLLLRVVLGVDVARRWVPLLERYYAKARRRSPATFLDFDRVWEDQRRRWQPLADADASGGASAQQAAVAPDTALDVPGRGVRAAVPVSARRRAPLSPVAPAAAVPSSPREPAVPAAALAARSGVPDLADALEEEEQEEPLAVSPGSGTVAPVLKSDGATGAKGAQVLAAAYASYYDYQHVFDLWRPGDWSGVRIGSRALARGSPPRPR